MATHHFNSWSLVLFVLSINLTVQHGGSVFFNFNFSDHNTISDNIIPQGDAFNSYDYISLARNSPYSTGRATYNQPVSLWDEDTGEVTDFTTRFSFLIKATSPTYTGDGFAFFLSPYPSQIPPNNMDYGRYLGLFNSTTGLNSSMNQIVAVEFDTWWNEDIDPPPPGGSNYSCHIGIDINTISSTRYKFINDSLCVNSSMTAQIEYSSRLKLLSLTLSHDADPKTKFNISATVDIRNVLPNISAVGFSAATGMGFELNQIFSWSFNSTLEKKPQSSSSRALSAPIIGVVVGGVVIMLLLAGTSMYYLRKNRLTENSRDSKEIIGDQSMDYEFEKGRGPKRFLYSELVNATNDFAKNQKLGEGGFGSVYRGILKEENIPVAVKRVSKESKQGKKEYISEVKIISQLRHRNLVQLIGWCHDHGEFLLVYELMCNGSLDNHLYSKESPLSWPIRHNIALGLGSALLYLHKECEQCVVHRDIKPSNIMLDSLFNAKLGDFGLARLIDLGFIRRKRTSGSS